MKFRKKPVEVEAYQWKGQHYDKWPDWLQHGFGLPIDDDGSVFRDSRRPELLIINTLEGCHNCRPNDWIVQGIKGELYPVKPDIFEATYEAVD